MSIEFLCQACGARLRIDDDLAGKPVKPRRVRETHHICLARR